MSTKTVDSNFEGDWRSLIGLASVLIVGCLASTAGVGGGAIFIPIFQALVGFNLKESTALSQALITAGSAVTVAINLFTSNPLDSSAPLIDFPLVLLMFPILLVGVGIGVLLNVILPSYIISVLLSLLLCLLITQSLRKGIGMWRSETEAKQDQMLLPCDLHDSLDNLEIGREGLREDRSEARSHLTSGNYYSGNYDASIHNNAEALVASTSLPMDIGDTHQNDKSGDDGGEAEEQQQQWQDKGISRSWHEHKGSEVLQPLLPRDHSKTDLFLRISSEPPTSSWLSRRNAWFNRFLNASELGEVHFTPPETQSLEGQRRVPLQLRGHQENHPSNNVTNHIMEHQQNNDQRPSEPSWALRRTSSLPAQRQHQPLLSPKDTALALVPRRRVPLTWGRHQPGADSNGTFKRLGVLLEGPDEEVGAEPPGSRGPDEEVGTESPQFNEISIIHDVSELDVHINPQIGTQCLIPESSVVVTSVSGERIQWIPPDATGGEATVAEGRARGEGGHTSQGPSVVNSFMPLGAQSVLQHGSSDLPHLRSSTAPLINSPHKKTSALARTVNFFNKGWKRLPHQLLLLLLSIWLLYLGLQIGRTLSGNCSVPYWILFSLQLVVMPSISVLCTRWMAWKARKKGVDAEVELVETKSPDKDEPPEMSGPGAGLQTGGLDDFRKFAWYQGFACVAGLIGGLLGLGGGMIIGPVLLEMGVHPQVSAASSSLMILASSSTALVSLAIMGRLNIQYAIVFSLASMMAALLGSIVIGGLIRKTGRISLVVLALASVMLIGGLVVTGFGIVNIIDSVQQGNLGPSSLCT